MVAAPGLPWQMTPHQEEVLQPQHQHKARSNQQHQPLVVASNIEDG
jgi:hypothetical protein